MLKWLYDRFNPGLERGELRMDSPVDRSTGSQDAAARLAAVDAALRNEVPEAIRPPSPGLRTRTLQALDEQYAAYVGRRRLRRIAPFVLGGLAAAAAVAWIVFLPGSGSSERANGVAAVVSGGMRLHGFTPASAWGDAEGREKPQIADRLEAAFGGMQAIGGRLSSQLPNEPSPDASRRPSLW